MNDYHNDDHHHSDYPHRADHWKDLGRNGLQLPTGEEQEKRPGAGYRQHCLNWDDDGNGDGDDDDDIGNIVSRWSFTF